MVGGRGLLPVNALLLAFGLLGHAVHCPMPSKRPLMPVLEPVPFGPRLPLRPGIRPESRWI